MTSVSPVADTTQARDFARPRIVLSRCLEVEACRYNGAMIRSSVVRSLRPFVNFAPVCPELEVGLGTPRDPIRLVRRDGETRLVQPSTGRDLTDEMTGFRTGFLDGLERVDGFLLKSRSPSCGIDGVKVYPTSGGTGDGPAGSSGGATPVDREPGMFAAAVLERFPETPVEHEGRLTKTGVRDRFLTRIFALADLRRVRESGRTARLVDLHSRHKFTLLAHSPSLLDEAGRVVASAGTRSFEEVVADYGAIFRRALAEEPDAGAHQNVLEHARGYFKARLSSAEKAKFGRLLCEFRHGRIGRERLLTLLQSWVRRFDESYLARQSYLHPYPRELLDPADPDR